MIQDALYKALVQTGGNEMKHMISRRSFLKHAACGSAAVPFFVRGSALGLGPRPAPSERLVMGCIGLGIQGVGNMREFLRHPDVQVAAVCDVLDTQTEKARAIVDTHYRNTDCRALSDWRKITQDQAVDAVLIAAPDHWHPLMGIDAARCGKHMYYEKPIGWSFQAAQALRSAVRRYGVVFQFGTQQRSSRDFRFACELVRNGRIGKLRTILVGVPGSVPVPMPAEEPVPTGFDYDMWLGPAPRAPYSYERTRPYVSRPDKPWTQNYSNWYHVSDYCIGFIGNWGIHHVDIAQWGGGTEDTGPTEIEGKAAFPTEGMGDCALTWQVNNTFANGVRLVHMDNDSAAKHPEQIPGFSQGILFKGDDGWVFVNRGRLDANPKSLLAETIGPNEVRLINSANHHRNFIDAAKGAAVAACPVDVAVRSDTICMIDNIAARLQRKLNWDPRRERFVDDDEANRMLTRTMRSPWTLKA